MLNSAIGYPFDWDLMCVLSPPLLYTAVFLVGRVGGGPSVIRAGSSASPEGSAPDGAPTPAAPGDGGREAPAAALTLRPIGAGALCPWA